MIQKICDFAKSNNVYVGFILKLYFRNIFLAKRSINYVNRYNNNRQFKLSSIEINFILLIHN